MKRTEILIVGGDMRQLYCAAKLRIIIFKL